MGPGDEIHVASASKKHQGTFCQRVRGDLQRIATSDYKDTDVRISGKVLAADVRLLRFQLYPQGQPPVQVQFNEAQEAEVIRALREHKSKLLWVRGQAEYQPDGRLKQISAVAELHLTDEGTPARPGGPSAAEALLALADAMPEESLEGVPTDGAARLDDYIYGEPDR